jgi:hypothetical protein
MLLTNPIFNALVAGELTASTTFNPPVATPDAPTPARARPTMNMSEDVAAPQTALPRRKIRKKDW